MTRKDIEAKVDERIKAGTAFSKNELMKKYLKIYSGQLNTSEDEVITYAKKFDIEIYNSTSKLYKIFKYIKTGKRFLDNDILWLIEKEFMKSKNKLSIEYNRREANFHIKEYEQKKDLWFIVRASSHFRKSNQPNKSIEIIEKINFNEIKDTYLKSALIITQGGAYRDIKELDKALKNAKKGYDWNSKDYHPCTLFGALYYEKHQYFLGDKWYLKAKENGAKDDIIEKDIYSIYQKRKGKDKEKLREHLKKSDYYYDWLK
ncbi:MAG: hypothetical protein PHY66_06445 [Aliarcobacter sp.]|nr:hypothetical protein [Aliarcobacter sp.]